MDNKLQTQTSPAGAQDGDIVMPSGAIAKVVKFSGSHALDVISGAAKGGNDAISEDDLVSSLLALTATYNGQSITKEMSDEMPGADYLFLMGEFAKSVNYEVEQKGLPETTPPDGRYYKRLPSGVLAMIANFKGKHIKEAQRQSKGDDFFVVLISRLVKLEVSVDQNYLDNNPMCKLDIGAQTWQDMFPEDIKTMDGLDVFALFGEVSAAMFPQK